MKELRKESQTLPVRFNLGKSGITETFISSLNQYLKVHNIVKIKILSSREREEIKKISEKICKKTESKLVDIKGFTITIFKNENRN